VAPSATGDLSVHPSSSPIRKRSTEIAFTIIALFMLSNILLATLFATFVIPRESSVSFSFLAGRKIGLLYRFIGYPFSFPLTLYFSLKTGLSPARCDLLFGNWLLQPGKRFGRARIDFGKNDRIFLGDGWSYPERWDGKIPFRWSCGEKSTLFFYLDKGEPLQMVVNAAPFVHPKMPKQMLFISVNGKKLPPITLAEGFNNYANSGRLQLPRARPKGKEVISGEVYPRFSGHTS